MDSFEYPAINAKVRYWMSFLITEAVKQDLLNTGYNDILEYIRQNEIKTEFESEDVRTVESSLKQVLVQYVLSGKRFVGGKARDFLYEWLRSYEIENLKMTARSLLSGRPLEFLYQCGRHSRVDMTLETIRNFSSLDDFQEFLRNTEYYEISRETFPRVKEQNNTFYWEMLLDNFFAYRLRKSADSLANPARKAVEELFFHSLEMTRLMWLYRMRFNYRFGMEECLSYIPNILKVLSRNRYLQLLEADTPDVFISLLYQWKLIPDNAEGVMDLQMQMNLGIRQRAAAYLRGDPFSFGIFLAFLLLKSQNIRWLIVLLEGKQAGLNQSTLARMLV